VTSVKAIVNEDLAEEYKENPRMQKAMTAKEKVDFRFLAVNTKVLRS
jgi:hypothetical protein